MQLQTSPSSAKHIYAYVNTSTQKTVLMYMMVIDSVPYLSLSGN